MKMNKEKRFAVIHKERHGIIGNVVILIDKQTGIQYLFVREGYAGGLTPLLNKDGEAESTSDLKKN